MQGHHGLFQTVHHLLGLIADGISEELHDALLVALHVVFWKELFRLGRSQFPRFGDELVYGVLIGYCGSEIGREKKALISKVVIRNVVLLRQG